MNRKLSLAAVVLVGACVHRSALPAVAGPPPAVIVTVDAPAPAVERPVRSRDSTAVQVEGVSSHESVGRDSVAVSPVEVRKSAAALFALGDSIVTGAPAHVAGDSAGGPTWDMDVRSYETTARVEYFVKIFSGRSKEHITAQLQRGARYETMIRAKMRAGKLPEDMYYLALIESGFDPNAYSRQAAVGMWQFMTSTARDMGMRVDWWVDERRDPVRSTDAAIRFLRYHKEQFGSLYLAAAAYDGGPGRLARGLSRYADELEGTTGEDVFFALAEKDYLPHETRDYVPQLIAAALVAKDPRRYGLELRPEPAFAYDSVRVGPATALAAIAMAAGRPLADVLWLNPFILRGVTPPRDSMLVRIPAGTAVSFDSAYPGLSREDRIGLHPAKSKKGDRLEDVARRAGLPAATLAIYNPGLKRNKKSGRLAPGQVVMVPSAAVVAAAFHVPDPDIEGHSSSSKLHLVKRGETLGGIARKYHTTVKTLVRLNGLRRPMIFAGQSLVVAGRASPASSARRHKTSLSKRGGTERKGGPKGGGRAR